MVERPAHKIQNKTSKYSQYSKGLEKDTEKMQINNDLSNNLPETATHKMKISVCIQIGGLF